MTLGSGAHVGLGTQEFMLDESVPEHYLHVYESLFAGRTDITGKPGRQNVRQELLFWAADDWSAGEGLKHYDPEQFARFWRSTNANTRIRGQLQGQPQETTGAITGMTPSANYPIVTAVSSSRMYVFNESDYNFSATGSSFGSTTTLVGASGFPTTEYKATAATGDPTFAYVAGWDEVTAATPTKPPFGNRVIVRLFRGSTDAVDMQRLHIPQTSGVNLPLIGLALYSLTGTGAGVGVATGNRLFGWTGRKLGQISTSSVSQAIANYKVVYDNGIDEFPGTGRYLTDYWGDCFATDVGIVMFYAAGGNTTVFEYFNGTGRPIWSLPTGFTGRAGCFQLGTVYVVGETDGKVALYALNIQSRQQAFLGYFRYDQALIPTTIEPGPGTQLLIGTTTGEYIVYEASRGAWSLLDTTAQSGTHAVAVFFKNRRMLLKKAVGSAVNWSSYADDEIGNLQSGVTASYESPAWDLDLPEEDKTLLGFHIACKALVSGQSIRVTYDTQGQTAYAGAGGTLSTVGAASGYLTVSSTSSTVTFRTLRIKVELIGTAVVPPTLYSITARCMVQGYSESWDLALRLRDEGDGIRPSSSRRSAPQLRNYILDIVDNKTVVEFKDGYRFPRPGGAQSSPGSTNANLGYTSHTVVIEVPQDRIDSKSEGTLRVRLRNVQP